MVSALTDHLGYLLRQLSNHVSQGFAQNLAAEGVTVAEWVFMRELYDEEALPSVRLAERLGMTRGAITKLGDRLMARGLILRGSAAADRRVQALRLTAAGRALVPRLAAMADANDAAAFGHLSPQDRDRLQSLLHDLIRHHGLHSPPTA